MRIFCPAMVVGVPLLPAALYVCSGCRPRGSPDEVSPTGGVRSPRSGVSRSEPRPVPGSPADPGGSCCARGPRAKARHATCRMPSPTRNPSRMPHRRAATLTGVVLLDDLGDLTGAYGATTLADGELQALLHGDRLDQLHVHGGVVARHDHLGAAGQGHDARHVRGAEVELRAVVVEERRVTAALVLGQDVDLALELRVRGGGA